MSTLHRIFFFFSALVASLIFLSTGASADEPPRAPLALTSSDLASVIDPMMTEWIEKQKGAGAVVVVVSDNATLLAKGYGFADISAQKPFTADTTLTRPGSISKLFTAIAVMQLVDEGKLDLDRDVNDYLDVSIPTPKGGVPVTLRLLLSHRAGFEEHAKNLFSRDRDPTPLGVWLAQSLPQRIFPNGDTPAYSNYGFALAGYIVERVSGEAFADYVERRILVPLRMSHSTFRQPVPAALAPLMARSYRRSDEPAFPFFETIPASPAGALSATGEDMGRFMRALLNGGALDSTRILSRSRLEEMTRPQYSSGSGSMGLAFFGREIAGHESFGHNGGTLAFISELTILPAQKIGVFVSLDGRGEGKPPLITKTIIDRFLPRAETRSQHVEQPATDRRLAGVYRPTRGGESSFTKISSLSSEVLVEVGADGKVSWRPAIWPFAERDTLKQAAPGVFESEKVGYAAFGDIGGPAAYLDLFAPVSRFLRAGWLSDIRLLAPPLIASQLLVLLTLLAWPVAALLRRRRDARSDRPDIRRSRLLVRLVLLADASTIAALAVLSVLAQKDLTSLNDALDPFIVAMYAFAWLGVLGAAPVVWIAARFWREKIGSRWLRIHHSLLGAATVFLAWFFVAYHVAGTTLNY